MSSFSQLFPQFSLVFPSLPLICSSLLMVFQHFPPFSSIFCNPSPLLPRHHSSSPCKPSCSEPQRTLLSVELRILSFFNMLASMFLAFSKLCLASISCLFSNLFLRSYGFSRVSFLQCPHFPTVSSVSLVFPSLPFIFSASFNVFFTIVLHFPLFLTIFLHFPWFFLPFSFRFQGT